MVRGTCCHQGSDSRTRRWGARASELFRSKLPLLLTQLMILSVYAASLLIVLVSYWNWMQILLACFRTKFIRFHPMQHLGGKQCIHIDICKSCPFQPPWPLTKVFSCSGLWSFIYKILYRLSLCSGPNIIMSRRSHPYPYICLLVSYWDCTNKLILEVIDKQLTIYSNKDSFI